MPIFNAYAETQNNSDVLTFNLDAGQIIITSATIIAFSGIGSVLAIRFQINKYRKQVILCLIAYGAILVITTCHLLVIYKIFTNDFTDYMYSVVILITIFFFSTLLVCFGGLTVLQKYGDDELADEGHHTERKIQKVKEEFIQKATTVQLKKSLPLQNLWVMGGSGNFPS